MRTNQRAGQQHPQHPQHAQHCRRRPALLRRLFPLLLPLLLVAAPPKAAAAQQHSPAADTARTAHRVVAEQVVVLPEVTVIATRTAVAGRHAPGYVVAIEDPDATQSVAEALAGTGLVHVRSYGGTGLAGLSIRGGGASQVAVVLDGFSLTNAQLGQFDLSLLPGAMVGRIEVMPGGASALYGSSAVSGVVRIATGNITGNRLQATTTIGAFGERAAVLGASAGRGSVSVSASLRMAQTDGDYRYLNTAAFPSTESRRENADRSDMSGRFVVQAHGANLRGSVGLLVVDSRRGLPGVAGAAPASDRQGDELVRLTGTVGVSSRNVNAEVAALFERSRLRYVSPLSDVDQTGVIERLGMRASVERPFTTVSWIRFAAEVDRSTARHPALATDASRTNASVSATGQTPLGRVSVFPAARLDVYSIANRDLAVVLTPRVGVSYPPWSRHPVSLKWTMGRAFRMPTLNDLYWLGPGARGQLDLDPERSWSTDVAVSVSGSAATAEATFFARNTRGQISWLPDDRGTWIPENLGTVRALGAQGSGTVFTSVAALLLTTSAGYSYTHARDVSGPEPMRLRYVPAHEGHLSLRISKAEGFFGQVELHGSGVRNVTADQSQTLPGFLVADVELGYQYTGRRSTLVVRLDLQNVSDARYSVVEGYPMPPRHIRVHTSITL